MKFPRNAKIFRGQLDAAPFAGVFFLLVIFMALSSNIIYTPGIRVNLPQGDDLPGTDKPTIPVSVDANGQYYYKYQIINEADLRKSLSEAVQNAPQPVTLVVEADKDVRIQAVDTLCLIAGQVGIKEALRATRPRPFSSAPIRHP